MKTFISDRPLDHAAQGIHHGGERLIDIQNDVTMAFRSILFDQNFQPNEYPEAPDCLVDLNLDQFIEFITAEKKEYNLKPFFYLPLHDPETIYYRQDVFRDLENPSLFVCIKTFSEKMQTLRRYLALSEKLDFNYHEKGWF